MAVNTQETLTFFATRVGAIKDLIVLFLQMWRAFQRHRSAHMVIRRLNILTGKAKMREQAKARIVQLFLRNAQHIGAELFAQGPLIEHKPNIKSRGQCRLDLGNLVLPKPMPDQCGVVDARRIADGAMTHRITDNLFDLGRAIAQSLKRGWHRAVDDFEIATTSELFEFHQRKIGFNPGRVTIHHQTNGAGWGNHRHLSIAKAVLFTKQHRLVPSAHRQIHQLGIGTVGVIQSNRFYIKLFIAFCGAISRCAMIADDLKHMFFVAFKPVKRAQLTSHFSRGRIGHTGHDRGQRPTQGTPLVAVITIPHVHQKSANIGVSQTQGTEVIRQLCDFLRRELRHHHRNLKRHGPQACSVHVIFGLKFPILQEGQQVHRRQVTGRIIQEHVFRTRVRPTDRAIFWAGVPGVHSVMILDARIGTGPSGVSDLIPQIAGFDGLGDGAIGATDQLPIRIVLYGLQIGIGHAY